MKKQKTIHVILDFYDLSLFGGMQVNMWRVYAAMVKMGWKVIFYTSNRSHTKGKKLPSQGNKEGIEFRRYDDRIFLYKILTLKKIFFGKDIISLHDFSLYSHLPVFLMTLFLKVLGKKNYTLIFTSHGLFNFDYPDITFKIRKFMEHTLGVFLINFGVDGIRAVSEYEKKGLIKGGVRSDLIQVITNGVENEAYLSVERLVSKKIKSLVLKHSPYILQVARIDRVKNFEVGIRALPYVSEKTKFLIAGAPTDRRYYFWLKKLISSLGLEKRVIFLGTVRVSDKYYLMKHALVLVHLTHKEGFGNAVHEAMSQGAICLVSNTAALTELIYEGVNGYLFSPKDHRGLAKRTAFILENKNDTTLKKMKLINIQKTRKSSWENVAKKVASFYSQTYQYA